MWHWHWLCFSHFFHALGGKRPKGGKKQKNKANANANAKSKLRLHLTYACAEYQRSRRRPKSSKCALSGLKTTTSFAGKNLSKFLTPQTAQI